MNAWLISGGLILGGFALRTFGSLWLVRLGAVAILAGTFRMGAQGLGSAGAGAAMASLWLVIPASRVLWSASQCELPLDKRFRPRNPPSLDTFPELPALTEEFEGAAFEHVEDIGWHSEHWEQFSRQMIHRDLNLQGSIHFQIQGEDSLSYVSLVTRTADHRQWTSWNYPYSLGLKLPPELILNREPGAASLADLLTRHQQFIARKTVPSKIIAPDAAQFLQLAQEELRRQIDHNLDAGLLRLSGGGKFTYSWRGTLFVLRQFFIDFLSST